MSSPLAAAALTAGRAALERVAPAAGQVGRESLRTFVTDATSSLASTGLPSLTRAPRAAGAGELASRFAELGGVGRQIEQGVRGLAGSRGGVVGLLGGGLVNPVETVAAKAFENLTPAGLLLSRTGVGREVAKLASPVVAVLNDPVVDTVLSVAGPVGRAVSLGAGVARKVVDDAAGS